jgi:hypothetical protein
MSGSVGSLDVRPPGTPGSADGDSSSASTWPPSSDGRSAGKRLDELMATIRDWDWRTSLPEASRAGTDSMTPRAGRSLTAVSAETLERQVQIPTDVDPPEPELPELAHIEEHIGSTPIGFRGEPVESVTPNAPLAQSRQRPSDGSIESDAEAIATTQRRGLHRLARLKILAVYFGGAIAVLLIIEAIRTFA